MHTPVINNEICSHTHSKLKPKSKRNLCHNSKLSFFFSFFLTVQLIRERTREKYPVPLSLGIFISVLEITGDARMSSQTDITSIYLLLGYVILQQQQPHDFACKAFSFWSAWPAVPTYSRVSDQNGVSLLYIMLEIHHSGREPSNYETLSFYTHTHLQ